MPCSDSNWGRSGECRVGYVDNPQDKESISKLVAENSLLADYIDELTEILCKTLSHYEKGDLDLNNIYQNDIKLWWDDHKRTDKIRILNLIKEKINKNDDLRKLEDFVEGLK